MKPTSGKTVNAFAALREEATVLKLKGKKERALERKARKEADAETVVEQVPVRPFLQQVTSWADVDDDSDTDEEVMLSAGQGEEEDNLKEYLSSSDDEGELSENDEEQDETDSHVGETSSIGHVSQSPTSRQQQQRPKSRKVIRCPMSTQEKQEVQQQQALVAGKQLSKKEKTKQELADLENLLTEHGLKTDLLLDGSQVAGAGNELAASDAISAATTAIANPSKQKQKKKKGLAAAVAVAPEQEEETTQPTSVPEETRDNLQPSAPTVSKDAALAKLKASAAKKKKQSAVSAVVMEEAKKKSDAKKAKQKKENKERLMFRPT